MKRLTDIARPDQTGNAPGLLRLRLLHARDVLGLADPAQMISSAHGVSLPPGGITLATDAQLVDVYAAPGQLSYLEQLGTVNKSKRWAQLITIAIQEAAPDRLAAAQVLAKGRWLAVMMYGNERCRLVGRPHQPLLCTSVQVDAMACTIKLEGQTPAPAFFVDDISTAVLLGEPSSFSFDFSFDFNS